MRFRAAYTRTEYRVALATKTLVFRVAQFNEAAQDALIQHCGLQRDWAILTPCNPRSQRQSGLANRRGLRELHRLLRALRLPHWPSFNHDPVGRWPEEPGVLLVDAERELVLGLGCHFRQNAVLMARINRGPELLWL